MDITGGFGSCLSSNRSSLYIEHGFNILDNFAPLLEPFKGRRWALEWLQALGQRLRVTLKGNRSLGKNQCYEYNDDDNLFLIVQNFIR